MNQFPRAPYLDPHAANRRLAEEGITDLRFLPAGFFKSRRPTSTVAVDDTAQARQEAQTLPEPPATQPDTAAALRDRAVAFLSLHGARTRPQAALALALRTDAEPKAVQAMLAGLPEGTVLDLPTRDRPDAAEAAEAKRMEGIADAAVAADRPSQASELIEAGVDLVTAQAILAAMPASAAADFEARMLADTDWFGDAADDMASLSKAGRTDAVWSKAVTAANEQFEKGEPDVQQ